MDLTTFVAHFMFIGLTFAGGVVVGWQTYQKAQPLLEKLSLKKKDKSSV